MFLILKNATTRGFLLYRPWMTLIFWDYTILLCNVQSQFFAKLPCPDRVRRSRRYKAKEIDALVNHPDTRLLDSICVFATPDALIGINRGITVVEYGDIASVRVKTIHHSQRKYRDPRGRTGFLTAMYYAATDQYNEWDTYRVIIKTKRHRRMVLTELLFSV